MVCAGHFTGQVLTHCVAMVQSELCGVAPGRGRVSRHSRTRSIIVTQDLQQHVLLNQEGAKLLKERLIKIASSGLQGYRLG